MRLITFGCSNTYGHCLPDCYIFEPKSKTYQCGKAPSQHAFPQLIADHFGCELHNKSFPGASNRYMWWEIVNFDFEPNDVVLCTWTFPNRHALIMPHRVQHLGCWPSTLPNNKNFHKFVASSNSNLDLEISSFLYMDHSMKQLNGKVKKILNYKVFDVFYNDIPDWCEIEFTDSLNFIVPEEQRDFADDGLHYGVESHKKFAAKMIRDLAIDSN